jgi:hypothetical protein
MACLLHQRGARVRRDRGRPSFNIATFQNDWGVRRFADDQVARLTAAVSGAATAAVTAVPTNRGPARRRRPGPTAVSLRSGTISPSFSGSPRASGCRASVRRRETDASVPWTFPLRRSSCAAGTRRAARCQPVLRDREAGSGPARETCWISSVMSNGRSPGTIGRRLAEKIDPPLTKLSLGFPSAAAPWTLAQRNAVRDLEVMVPTATERSALARRGTRASPRY